MSSIATLNQNLAAAVRKYYSMLLVAFVAAVAFVLEIERGSAWQVGGVADFYLKVGWVGLLGISLQFALHIAQQRYRIKWPLPLVGLLVLVGYYFWLPAGNIDQPYTVALLGVSAVSFHLLVAVVPFWKPGNAEGFWDYNKNVFINMVQTGIFTVVIWGGLALALVAVEHLFGVHVPSDCWGYLATTVLILGSALVFALFAKGGFETLETVQPYPLVLKFFVQYVLIPLLIVYLLILYSYGLMILLDWNLPQGWVSYLVLAYSFLGVFSLLLLHPLREVADKIWVRFFSRAFYITLLPLLVLLFVAIGVRINDYGVTENRYYVLLAACWLLGMAVYQLLTRRNRIWVIPVSLLLVAYPTLWLPGLNVWSVSVGSQEYRLHRLLAENQLLANNGKIDFRRAVKRTALAGIADKMHYLDVRNEDNRIRRLIAQEQVVQLDSLLQEDYRSSNSFEGLFINVIEDTTRSVYTNLQSKQRGNSPVYCVSGWDYFIPEQPMNYERKFTVGTDSLMFHPTRREISLYVPTEDTTFRYDYSAYLDSVYSRYRDRIFTQREIDVDDGLSLRVELGNYEVELRFDQLMFRAKGVGQFAPQVRDSVETTVTGSLLLRRKR